MDRVEIFLLSIVVFSVLVFLILDWLKSEKSRNFYDSESKTIIGSWASESIKENDPQEEEESVSTKKQTGCEHEIEGEEGLYDDWEGIERTELEKIFGEAVVFVSSKRNVDQIRDVKLELYGLEKVALEGPCHESQPMALKVSARSKWNAWHKLGSMSREMAMEKYVDILSKAIPNWKVDENFISSRDNCLNTPRGGAIVIFEATWDISVIRPNIKYVEGEDTLTAQAEDLTPTQNKNGVEVER